MRGDSVFAGRNRALLETIIAPERCEIEGPISVIEKWEARKSEGLCSRSWFAELTSCCCCEEPAPKLECTPGSFPDDGQLT